MKKIIIIFICALVCVNSLFAQFADVIIGKWDKVMDLVGGNMGGALAPSQNSESFLFSPMMFTSVRIDPDGTVYHEGMQLTEVIPNGTNSWTVLLCTNDDMQTLPSSHNARFTAWNNQIPQELNAAWPDKMATVNQQIAGKDYMVIILHSTMDTPNLETLVGNNAAFSPVSGGGQSTLDSNPNYKPRAKSMMLILVR